LSLDAKVILELSAIIAAAAFPNLPIARYLEAPVALTIEIPIADASRCMAVVEITRKRITSGKVHFAMARFHYEMNAPTVHRIYSGAPNSRRNFGALLAKRRGESNFLRAFERAYFEGLGKGAIAAGEFALSGYGVADLVWIAWSPLHADEDFSAYSLVRRLQGRQLFAFEAKLRDWRKALQQAFRYRYFADKAIVLMPHEHAGPALENLEVFRHLSVGFWTFERSTGSIRRHLTPMRVKALNLDARSKAIALISTKVNLRKLREQLDASA
jgi:hypothetical protein